MIDKDFFKQYQKQIRWFANTSFGRYFFRIHNDCPKDKKIIEIGPNYYKIDNRNNTVTTDIRLANKFSFRLNTLLMWLPFNVYKEDFIHGKWMLQPKMGLTVSTFYPQPFGSTTTSCAGFAQRETVGTWAQQRDGNGTFSDDDRAEHYIVYLGDTGSSWEKLQRAIYNFDTSAIGAGQQIDSAIFSVYGSLKQNTHGGAWELALCPSNSASNIAIVNSDYEAFTDDTDYGNATISYTNFDTAGYNAWTLNATGEGAIEMQSITKLGLRLECDLTNTEPSHGSAGTRVYFYGYYPEQAGTTNDPKLVVTHSTAPTTQTATIQSKGDIKQLNLSKTVQSKARVEQSDIPTTVQAKGAVKQFDVTKSIQSKARLKDVDQLKTVQSKAKIEKSTVETVQSKATIKQFDEVQTVQSKAAVEQQGIDQSIQSKARIETGDLSKTIQSKARILAGALSKTIQSKARVESADQLKTVQSKARVEQAGVSQTIQSKGAVKQSDIAKTITTRARVETGDLSKTVTAKARIEDENLLKTIQTKGRVEQAGVSQTVQAKARLESPGVGKTIQGKANIWAFPAGYVKMKSEDVNDIKSLNDNRIT